MRAGSALQVLGEPHADPSRTTGGRDMDRDYQFPDGVELHKVPGPTRKQRDRLFRILRKNAARSLKGKQSFGRKTNRLHRGES